MASDTSPEDRRFEAAVKVMRSLPEDGTFEPSDEMLAMFYSYYKQATVGPCNTSKPNGWDSIGKAKWDAWKALGDMTKEQAMKEYVQEIQLILEAIPVTEDVAELMDELDPFYEVVDDEDDDDVTATSAILANEAGVTDEEPDNEEDEASFEEHGEEGMELEDSSEDILDVLDMIGSAGMRKADLETLILCNGSAEVSSLTNGTHSSLNTEEDEEELTWSRENNLDSADGFSCTDHISEEVSEQKHQSDDPDCEVYSNSVDHPAAIEFPQGSGTSRVCLAESWGFGARRPEEPRGSQDGKRQETLLPIPVAAGPVQSERDSADRGRGEHHSALDTTLRDPHVPQCVEKGPVDNKRSMNTQIASALSRLQDDMQNVLQRLNTLEALTAAQCDLKVLPLTMRPHSQSRINCPAVCSSQGETCPPGPDPHSASVNRRFHLWPLNTSPVAVALVLIWPFAVNWLVQLYLQRKRRRIK